MNVRNLSFVFLLLISLTKGTYDFAFRTNVFAYFVPLKLKATVNFHEVKAGKVTNSIAVNNIRRLQQINEVHDRKSRVQNFSTSLRDLARRVQSND